MKLKRKTNFRVEVSPRSLGNYGIVILSDGFLGESPEEIEKGYQKRCQEIADDIRRHVDNVSHVEVICDTNCICSHCGLLWEVSEDDSDPDFPKGTPFCCEEAIKEFQESKSKDSQIPA